MDGAIWDVTEMRWVGQDGSESESANGGSGP